MKKAPDRVRLAAPVFAGFLAVVVAGGPRGAAADTPETASGAAPSAAAPVPQILDELLAAAWARDAVSPAPAADDTEFLRRLSLDLTGRIPTVESVIAFVRDRSPRKRHAKIEELLESPQYADHMADTWLALLVGRRGGFTEAVNRPVLREWLWTQFRRNTPYDQIVSSLLAAAGKNDENGAANYLLRFQEAPLDAVGHATRVFLGVQIQCAQCHNHPYEPWTQEDFYGMASFFSGFRGRRISKDDDPKYIFELYNGGGRDMRIPGHEDKGRIRAKLITGEQPKGNGDLRAELAALATSPDNPYFAKALVNRLWALLFGRGFVDPVDDFREGNPPVRPEIFEWLSGEFVRSGHDLKHLLRTVLNSQAYQRTSRVAKGNAGGPEHFARARLRPLSPEQIFASMVQATGPEALLSHARAESAQVLVERTLQRFIHTFTDDEMQEVAEFEGTIPQALLLLNGLFTNEAVKGIAATKERKGAKPQAAAGGMLDTILREHPGVGERLDWIFLTVLGRQAGDAERARFAGHVMGHGNKREGYEDAMWALLNSTEFIFNH